MKTKTKIITACILGLFIIATAGDVWLMNKSPHFVNFTPYQIVVWFVVRNMVEAGIFIVGIFAGRRI